MTLSNRRTRYPAVGAQTTTSPTYLPDPPLRLPTGRIRTVTTRCVERCVTTLTSDRWWTVYVRSADEFMQAAKGVSFLRSTGEIEPDNFSLVRRVLRTRYGYA